MKFNFPPSEVPPDMYRATMPDGMMIREAGRRNWYTAIKNHYLRNGYALPDNWQEYYEDRLCRILPAGFCIGGNGEIARGINAQVRLEDLKHGMQVLWNVTRSENPLVDKQTASKRAAICASCPANIDVPGCKPCIGLANTILDIKGKGTTQADPFLRVCAVCRCSNQAQVWVKSEILAKGVDVTQLHDMQKVNDECWKAKELTNQS